jgi:hypothetical protein
MVPVKKEEAKPSAVVLLGAGASVDAGLKTSLQLTAALRESVSGSSRDLQKALGLILGGVALQRGGDGGDVTQPVDIETVLRVAQMLFDRARSPLAPFVGSWIPALEDLAPARSPSVFRQLMLHAQSLLRQSLKTPEDPTQLKYLAGISKLGSGKLEGLSKFPTVFTLNYDLCLERALEYEEVPFTTGFKTGVWTDSELDRDDCIKIYKLHGSLGWVRHKTTLYERGALKDREDVPVESDEIPDELIFAVDNKLKATQPFMWMMNRFWEHVAKAPVIVTVGYSYSDAHINEIIAQGMAAEPSRRLIAVGPNLDEPRLSSAPGFENYYPERTTILTDKAKQALMDSDTILKTLVELMSEKQKEVPFA